MILGRQLDCMLTPLQQAHKQQWLSNSDNLDNVTVWQSVNYTSRTWTKTESGYGQIEKESNGILTGMMMNNMYALGTHTEVVTEHKPLIPIYSSSKKPNQLCVESHRVKLLPFQYNVVLRWERQVNVTYVSWHPEKCKFTQSQIREWCVDERKDAYVNQLIEEGKQWAPVWFLMQPLQIRTLKNWPCFLKLVIKASVRNSCQSMLS